MDYSIALKKHILSPVKYFLLTQYNSIRVSGKQKIFCIGLNKTGTTSLEKEMKSQGFIVGNQHKAELLFNDWLKRDFRNLIKYCKSAQFFQDFPFSLPYTFIVLDQAFPGSKFILTIRDDSETWYQSLIKFHGKLWGNGNVPPTSEDLKNANYIYKGFPFHVHMSLHNVTEDEPYKKEVFLEHYETYIRNVKNYFRYRPKDLLIINLKDNNSYLKFCDFLDIRSNYDKFPWENKT